MNYLVYALLIVTIFLLLLILLSVLTESSRTVSSRLTEIRGEDVTDDDELKKPFIERALLPVYNSLFSFMYKFTPKNLVKYYNGLILQAGIQDKYTPTRILLNQILIALVSMGSIFILLRAVGGKINWPLIIMFGVIAALLPLSMISSKARNRQTTIRKSLPDVLDMLYVSVEAGLSFDSAMKKTAAKMSGPLTDEINRAMDDITKGKEREEALRSIGIRSQVEDVSSFITAVIQSEILGANIANMLRIQSKTMREKRRQRAEEEAMRIPLKMLFPMIFFLFPALFVIILGPALMNIFKTLSGF